MNKPLVAKETKSDSRKPVGSLGNLGCQLVERREYLTDESWGVNAEGGALQQTARPRHADKDPGGFSEERSEFNQVGHRER